MISTMQVFFVVSFLFVALQTVHGQGAGRAIPIATENYVIDLFRRINRNIEYDTTNFLVDLSGNYANCDFIGRRQYSEIARRSPEGERIGLLQDFTYGTETHTKAVDGYLRPVFDGWMYDNAIAGAADQIRRAKKFGCSVRPGCNGQVSVACLFTPYGPPPYIRTTKPPRPPPVTTRRPAEQRAKAFTPQQYDEAEALTKQMWDRSHFLENLSGFETRCDMLGRPGHSFPYAKEEAASRGKEVIGLYGSARNRGSTPVALKEILDQMKEDTSSMLESDIGRLAGFFDPTLADPQIKSKEVGCSLIPDCMVGEGRYQEMWVVVSCIFEI